MWILNCVIGNSCKLISIVRFMDHKMLNSLLNQEICDEVHDYFTSGSFGVHGYSLNDLLFSLIINNHIIWSKEMMNDIMVYVNIAGIGIFKMEKLQAIVVCLIYLRTNNLNYCYLNTVLRYQQIKVPRRKGTIISKSIYPNPHTVNNNSPLSLCTWFTWISVIKLK